MNKLAQFVKNDRMCEVLTQDAYAERVGIAYATLNRLENGHAVKINVLRKLSFYYNIDKRELYKMMITEIENENN